MSTEKGGGVRDRGTPRSHQELGSPQGEAQKSRADCGFREGHARHVESERRPCHRVSWNPKAWGFGDFLGTAKMNAKYL